MFLFTTNSTISKSKIDVIFTTNPVSHTSTGVLKITLSDHYLIHTVIRNYRPVVETQQHNEVKFTNYKRFDGK